MKSNSAILSTAYFPPIQYFTKFLLYDKILIEQYETYSKQSYRNRCEIYGANGKLTLSVPILKKHNKKVLIKDIQISYDTNWIKLHLKSIESAYRSAPFYEFYIDEILTLFQVKPKYLMEFNLEITETILSFFKIENDINLTANYEKHLLSEDFRDSIHPKKRMQSEDNEFNPVGYYQVFSERYGFLPNLSILDILFNKGPEAKSVLNNIL